MLERHTDVRLALGLLLLSMTCLVALVAVMKVVLLGSGPVSPRSMRLMAAAVLVGGLGSAVSPLIASPRWVGLQPMITLVEALLVACAGSVAVSAGAAPATRAAAYSKLPYFAVAATSLLLAAVAYGDHTDVGPVATGAIAVSAAVGLRQLVALRDNALLLSSVRRHEQRMRYQASHDALTGLVNRARFAELLTSALLDQGPVAVLLIDLDDFKGINDTLGHGVGDEVLVTVAERLRRAVRHDDVVARLGGDEFAMLLRDVDAVPAVDVAGRIHDALGTPIHTTGHELLVHASVGIATSTPGDVLETLLRNADLAMYSAKERGKGGHFVYVPGMTTRIVAHAELGAQLRDAIDAELSRPSGSSRQLFLLYQPIVRLDDGRTAATEALVRWRHPSRGVVPPLEFIPAAEQTGLIVPLGRWVLREACRQQATWLRDLGAAAPRSVSVNVAGRQLTDPQFVADVVAALDDAGLDARHLTLEVTETAVLDSAEAVATLEALRGLRVKLALDDFGTAASSLGLLLTCPVTSLKLDRTFVAGITTVARQEAVATAVIRMAQALDLAAVAEGIETQAQARMLRHLGYRFGQGYLYARPLPPDEVAAMSAPALAGRNPSI
ncbi:putative bifunctional diguanylate cyclase/phosphodiesterase [Dactylosporangium sp. CA-152071]|uniref:putative bifunctional diguanylate cyclase/phosphodiesterase n=1 Tax=Dactylosporangium sp. CA-152071 TaxID=3239933 RepID=UPI003D8C21CC